MVALFALIALSPLEMRLPAGAMCPDGAFDLKTVHVAYGDGKDGWYTTYGGSDRVRINSEPGTVHAAGERGPKIALSNKTICAAWQGDYRQGPKVWFSRSIDGGKTFERQKDLLDGTTPGIDHVEISSRGDDVFVFWLDPRGGQDPDYPVTNTIWYSVSRDGGATFGKNMKVFQRQKIRACACCSFSVGADSICYRGGFHNQRDVWLAQGDPITNDWSTSRQSSESWVFEGCPMDGPRRSSRAMVWTAEGKVLLKDEGDDKPRVVGRGKYANVLEDGQGVAFVTWQNQGTLNWMARQDGSTGSISCGDARAAVVRGPNGSVLIIH